MVRIIQVGLGEIGRNVVAALVKRGTHAQLVALVDANPALQGQRLAGLVVEGSIGAAMKRLKGRRPEVAVVTTGSKAESVAGTIRELADAGIHVVSSCEELAWPRLRSPKLTAELDRYAAKRGVAVLGTGVNPGFAMDAFALACTAPCTLVRGIKVRRSLDAAKRRYQLQKKVAPGMDVAACKKLIKAGKIGHVGLSESIAMIAQGLGWKLDAITEKFAPVVAKKRIAGEHFRIEAGEVQGLWMRGFGRVGRKTLIELDLTMAFGVETFDEVVVDGEPPLVVKTTSGFPGDASTVGMLVNCVDCVGSLEPGVRTMLDVMRVRSVGG